jgi:hypothetical protein
MGGYKTEKEKKRKKKIRFIDLCSVASMRLRDMLNGKSTVVPVQEKWKMVLGH